MKSHRGVIYRSYNFGNRDQDPIIGAYRTIRRDEGLKIQHVAVISGVSPGTLQNWENGITRNPRFTTMAAVGCGLGYESIQLNHGHPYFEKTKEINYDKERDKAANEILRANGKHKRVKVRVAAKTNGKLRTNGHVAARR